MKIWDIAGVTGVCVVLWYYFLLNTKKCSSDDLSFSVANFLGSFLILLSIIFNWNLSSFIIESVWIIISLYGIIKHVWK